MVRQSEDDELLRGYMFDNGRLQPPQAIVQPGPFLAHSTTADPMMLYLAAAMVIAFLAFLAYLAFGHDNRRD